MLVIWKLRERPIRLITNGLSPPISVPLSLTEPELATLRPEIRLKVVGSPAPLGPIGAWRSPFGTLRLTPRIISVCPKFLRTSVSSSAAVIVRLLPFPPALRPRPDGRAQPLRANPAHPLAIAPRQPPKA